MRRGPGRLHRRNESAWPGAPGPSAARPRGRPRPSAPRSREPARCSRARPARGPVSSGPNLLGAGGWGLGSGVPRGVWSGGGGAHQTGSGGRERPPCEHEKVRASEFYSLYCGSVFLVLPWKVPRPVAARARGGRAGVWANCVFTRARERPGREALLLSGPHWRVGWGGRREARGCEGRGTGGP